MLQEPRKKMSAGDTGTAGSEPHPHPSPSKQTGEASYRNIYRTHMRGARQGVFFNYYL